MDKLPRKPWEDPEDYDNLGANAYEGDDGRDRAQKNIRRFVEAHVVPESPWKEGVKVKTLGSDSTEIWWEEKDGNRMVRSSLRHDMFLFFLPVRLMLRGRFNLEILRFPLWQVPFQMVKL